MGRPKDRRFSDLMPYMTARDGARGSILYYHQRDKKKTALGKDKDAALKKYHLIEAGHVGSKFAGMATAYEAHLRELHLAGMLAKTSLVHYELALGNLRQSFGKGALEQIKPMHVKQYMRLRSKKGAAIFERKVGSAMWNWAREEGVTSLPNPFAGIKFSHAERKVIGRMGKRERYVTNSEFAEVHGRADPILQDAMDLAYLTGQRPSDVLKMARSDMKEGTLLVVQGKTGAKVPIRIEGKLKLVLERALARPRSIQSMYVIADKNGQRLTMHQLNDRFVKARGAADWQFRDIRAKAATDLPDIRHAQLLLGHKKETTTTIYRRSTGESIAPLDVDI